MIKIVFLDRDTVGPSVEITRPGFDHEWVEHGKTAPDQVAERIAEADIVITNKAPIRAEQLAAAPNLKMISIAATGYDVIDMASSVSSTTRSAISRVRGLGSSVRGLSDRASPASGARLEWSLFLPPIKALRVSARSIHLGTR